jgi:hypothetical protein
VVSYLPLKFTQFVFASNERMQGKGDFFGGCNELPLNKPSSSLFINGLSHNIEILHVYGRESKCAVIQANNQELSNAPAREELQSQQSFKIHVCRTDRLRRQEKTEQIASLEGS